jgi:uncharacterized protein
LPPYAEGRGVKQDYAEAAKWLRNAAYYGFAEAQNNLARLYDKGRGFTRDCAEALKWYRKAAGHGLAEAQYNVAVMYFNCKGFTQDYIQAHMWVELSANGLKGTNREAAKLLRDQIAKMMTSQQIVKARALAREWSRSRQSESGTPPALARGADH